MKQHQIVAALAVLLLAGGAWAQTAKPALYTADQAQAGAGIYAQACASCHGGALEGGGAPALKGAAFAERAVAQGMTPQSLYDVVAFTMPQVDPGGLKPEEYTALVSFILQQNGYPAGTTPLAPGAPGMKETKVTP
jgi:mono/diheme cytochrome c family protein